MSEKTTYHPLVEKARQKYWGDLGLVEPDDAEQWKSLTARQKAQYLGARSDCPVVNTLADDPSFGPRRQIQRYTDVTFAAFRIYDEMRWAHSSNIDEFEAPVDLTPFGGRRKHDPDWVPPERMNEISGAETYFTFVLSRQVIDVRNVGRDGREGARNKEQALSLAAEAESLPLAVAKLGLLSTQLGIPMEAAESRMFPEDWQEELPPAYWEPILAEVKHLFDDLKRKK